MFVGEVVGITDGDTLEILRAGKAVRIRLHGVDCPESHQAFGTKAKQYTAMLTFRHSVTVKIRDTDRYGRFIGEVSLSDGRSLNQLLVQEGFAWWYRQYAPDDPVLARLEAEAKDAKRGLWSDPHAIPPWEFRTHKRSQR